MKRCPQCGQYKPATEYYFRGHFSARFGPYCNPCQNAYCKAHYQRNKALHNQRRRINQKRYTHQTRVFLRQFLSDHPCVDCGENDPTVLEFDHVVAKKWEISHMVRSGYSIQRIEAEILKCEVRCANCHRRKTARDFNWFKFGA